MRVALLSYRSKPHCGGQGVYVRNLSRELVGLGHRVEVFSGPPYPDLDPGVELTRVPSLDLYREPDPFRTPHWRELRDLTDVLEVATMWSAGFPEPLTFSLRAAKLLRARAGEFDVVHDNQCLGYGLLGLRRAGLPLVATVHHPITHDRRLELAAAEGWRRFGVRRWYGFLRMQGRVARRIPELLTVSESSARDIVEDFGVDPGRLRVVPLGVDHEVFRPPERPRVPGRIVAMASADTPLKGVGTLLEAVAKLRTEREVELVLVASPTPGGPTERLIDELDISGAVRTVSGISDEELAELVGSAEIACVPSLYEGFSLPTVEAMSCGTPLVASRAGAIPEVAGPDGECADLVPPGDAEALAGALGALLDDPERRRRMGENGRQRVLDLGCGAGRHSFEYLRRGANVVAFDQDTEALAEVETMFGAMAAAGEVPEGASATTVSGDALGLPFPDDHFDQVIASEIMEHIPEDEKAMRELVRVVRPGGRVVVTVPRQWPERICWALSDEYHQVEGGHVRIYRREQLIGRLREAGLREVHHHHAHALHSPYWWLKCAVGVDDGDHPLPKLYHKLLVWDLMKKPWLTRTVESALNPVLGKSLAVYLYKPGVASA
ncbi:glycosyltransferase [Saccharopolyspora sp. 6M]|uniref:glycosyltransferase n=1 Tax=Saccharopolyspora sp. 6M TaxID=2877237 RepID=UPI001CD28CA6|nr:glycosyltransferase [Saccharopolyspora sp. 6M]MCA1227376.1 glycosyltransferase [Saccharopolyspora sp. 6M]